MSDLYGRTWELTIGSLDVTKLDLTFGVRKTSKREPNTAVIEVYNLSRASRSQVESELNALVRLKAGYGDDPPLLFVGTVRQAYSERRGPDIVTTIEASDKGLELTSTRLSRSYNPGTPVLSVLVDTLSALDIGEGNVNTFADAYRARNGTDNFPDGYVVSGSAKKVLNNIVRSAGLIWSVQDGVLQLQEPQKALNTPAVLLSSSTGLVGSPTQAAPERGKRSTVNAVSLIQPLLYPGAKVVLEAMVEGTFEITEVDYTGETRGNDWYANLILRPL